MKPEIDTSTTFRIVAMLKLIMDEPEVHTRKSICERFKVSRDTVKLYLRAMREAGFEVKTDYPDYTYYIDNITIKYESMKITKEFLSKEFNPRHNSRKKDQLTITVYKQGFIAFSKIFVEYSHIRVGTKIGFELDESSNKIYLIMRKGDFSTTANLVGTTKNYRITDSSLILFFYKHYQIPDTTKSFKLLLTEVEEDKFEMNLK